MGEWIKSNLGVFILGCIFTIGMGINVRIQYLDEKADKEIQKKNDLKFETLLKAITDEGEERKAEDEKLELMINTKLSIAQFNEFKEQFKNMGDDITVIQGDVKEILKNY